MTDVITETPAGMAVLDSLCRPAFDFGTDLRSHVLGRVVGYKPWPCPAGWCYVVEFRNRRMTVQIDHLEFIGGTKCA